MLVPLAAVLPKILFLANNKTTNYPCIYMELSFKSVPPFLHVTSYSEIDTSPLAGWWRADSLKSASFIIIVLLHKGLSRVHSEKKAFHFKQNLTKDKL